MNLAIIGLVLKLSRICLPTVLLDKLERTSSKRSLYFFTPISQIAQMTVRFGAYVEKANSKYPGAKPPLGT